MTRRVTDLSTELAWAVEPLGSCPQPSPPGPLGACSTGLKPSGRQPAGTTKHAYISEPFLLRLNFKGRDHG